MIDPEDVEYYGMTASVSSRRKARQSRALDDRSYTFTFRHRPTGTQVQVETGIVHWSRKQTKLEIEKLRTSKETLEKLERMIRSTRRSESS